MIETDMHHPVSEQRVSVIVPTWNEEAGLPACIASVGAGQRGVELIVADGGSTDRTMAIAAELGARIVLSPVRQRATQMNLAVQHARGDVLLFLHADTILPDGWLRSLRSALDAQPSIIGGAFRRRFAHPSVWLRINCALADWRGHLWGIFLGDQATFVRSADFWSLGGFRSMDQCEDLDFSIRMSRAGNTRMIRSMVLSSGRRFARLGPFRQSWADLATAIRFLSNRTSAAELSDVHGPEPRDVRSRRRNSPVLTP